MVYMKILMEIGFFVLVTHLVLLKVLLPDMLVNCQSLLDTGQLFKGHTKFHHVYQA
jgi:hypothetical protein